MMIFYSTWWSFFYLSPPPPPIYLPTCHLPVSYLFDFFQLFDSLQCARRCRPIHLRWLAAATLAARDFISPLDFLLISL